MEKDYEFLLHKLRTITYGPKYKLECTCPICLNRNTETLDLSEFPVIECPDDFESLLTVELPQTKHVVTMKLQTPRMLDDITIKIKSDKKTQHTVSYEYSEDSARLFYTLRYIIASVDGENLNVLELEDFIKNLPMRDTNCIINRF